MSLPSLFSRTHFAASLVTCLATAAAFGALGACGSSSSSSNGGDAGSGGDAGGGDGSTSGCATSGTGTLALTVTGLTSGIDAKVKVDGPAGSQAPTASAQLSLAGGTYTITAARVIAADPLVRTVFVPAVDTSSTCVADGKTVNVTVTYTPIPTSHRLWSTNANGTDDVLAFTSDSLQASGSPTADRAVDLDRPLGLAFDKDGGLWAVHGTAGSADQELAYYKSSTLASPGKKTPDVVLTNAAFNTGVPGIHGVALDASGNLWVTAPSAGKVLRIDAASLGATGSPNPSVEISGVTGASAIAFDGAGDLWVASPSANRVVEFTAAHLGTSTSAAPDRSLGAQTSGGSPTALDSPSGIAFDGSNQMWVTWNGSTLTRFTATERAGSGDAVITPAVQIGLDVAALAEGLAFDEGGGVWLAWTSGKIARFSSTQLAASGQPAPDRLISSASVGSAGDMAIFPAPANSPLFAALP